MENQLVRKKFLTILIISTNFIYFVGNALFEGEVQQFAFSKGVKPQPVTVNCRLGSLKESPAAGKPVGLVGGHVVGR